MRPRTLPVAVALLLIAGFVAAQENGVPSTKAVHSNVVPVPSVPAPTGAPTGKLHCAKPTFDFGEVSQGEEVSHAFVVENVGKVELEIKNVQGTCGCTHSAAEKTRLGPGEKTNINAKINTTGKQGPLSITVNVTTDDTSSPISPLTLSGRVAQPCRPSVTELNFGTLRKGASVEPRTFEILISGAQSITDVKVDNELVKASFEPIAAEEKKQGYKITVKLDGLLPVGQLRSTLSVGTTVPAQKIVTIPVLATVEGEIALKPRTFNFGKVKAGDAATKVVEIEKAGNADLKIEDVQVKPEGAFTAKLEEVTGGKSYKIVLGIAPTAKEGYSRGTVSIKTNCPGETDLAVYFYALLEAK
jgi:Protein of unknown function (DUF1573)